jgi:hypothetical protein
MILMRCQLYVISVEISACEHRKRCLISNLHTIASAKTIGIHCVFGRLYKDPSYQANTVIF